MNDVFSIPVGFDNWLLNLVCFCALVALLIHIWRMTRPVPSFEHQLEKFRAHVHDTFATKAELIERFDLREESAVHFRDDISRRFGDLDKKLSERSTAIFDAIRSMGREISHIDGQLKGRKS